MDLELVREDMVDSLEHEAKAVVHSDAVSAAMRTVPRHEFVEDERGAYNDTAHRVAGSRVLSPSTVGRLLEALSPTDGDETLVVGAGVGYTAAVLAEMAGPARVHAIDIDRGLVLEARRNLERAGYAAVLVDRRDGARGLAEYEPFDRILVEAAAVDPPAALLDQLAPDGRLVMPSGTAGQTLVACDADGETRERFGPVSFAPLLVEGEQATAVERNRTEREDRERAEQAAETRAWREGTWLDRDY
jgi:protein-L-isoaspartate(D-aspartate) O-methyltransferase